MDPQHTSIIFTAYIKLNMRFIATLILQSSTQSTIPGYLPWLGGQGGKLEDPSGDNRVCRHCVGAVCGPQQGPMLAAGTAHHLLCDALTIPQLFVFAGRIRDGPLFVCQETTNKEIE